MIWKRYWHVPGTKCSPHTCIPLRPNLLSVSLYGESFSSYGINFEKSFPIDPKWPWRESTQSHTHPGPKVLSVSIHGDPFCKLVDNFEKTAMKCPKWPWHVQTQDTILLLTCTPESQTFFTFALWCASLHANFWENCIEGLQNDLDMLMSKVDSKGDSKWNLVWHVNVKSIYVHTSGRPNANPFRPAMNFRPIVAQFQNNCLEWLQNGLSMLQVKGDHVQPIGPNLAFSSRQSRLNLERFLSAPNDPKMPLTVSAELMPCGRRPSVKLLFL